jgi:hypothetical protein
MQIGDKVSFDHDGLTGTGTILCIDLYSRGNSNWVIKLDGDPDKGWSRDFDSPIHAVFKEKYPHLGYIRGLWSVPERKLKSMLTPKGNRRI